MSIQDFFQEGILGLMTAVKRFDINKGNKFSTYAVYWIDQAMERAIINTGFAIRIPAHTQERLFRVRRVWAELYQNLNHEPTVEEIVNGVNADVEKRYLERVEELKGRGEEPPKHGPHYYATNEVEGLIKTHRLTSVASLDSFFSDSNDPDKDLFQIMDSKKNSVEDEEDRESGIGRLISHDISRLLQAANLNEQLRRILVLRFGLEGNDAQTLEQVGKEFNLTRERIRQLEKKALAKIRGSRAARKILAGLVN
jgi:RNA polymerase primary sigma factor